MKTSHSLASVLAALIVGCMAGYFIAGMRYGKTAAEIISTDEFVRTCDSYQALLDLRAGDTNAVFNCLEGDLDMGIVFLAAYEREFPPERTQKYRNVLLRIREYRAKFPRHTEDPTMDTQVAQALAEGTKEIRH